MSELAESTRTVGVHVKNSNWITEAQLIECLTALQTETNTYLERLAYQVSRLKDLPESETRLVTQAGDYIDLEPYDRGHITLAIDGNGEEFEATVVVMYQARKEGEFVLAKLVNSDGVEVSETASKSAFYKVLAPQGQTIRAVMKSYAYGEVYVTLSANYTGSN